MSSNINPYNIDGTFPVAGQDNSSQGFRDNFTNVKNNFIYAQSEINDLQSKALLTSALNGQTITNDMAGTQITRPQLKAWTQALVDHNVISTNITLDFNTANFHKITTGGSFVVTFANWPATVGANAIGYGSLRLWVVVTDAAHTMTLPHNPPTSGVIIADDDIAGYNGAGIFSFDKPGNYIFDISSIDGGITYIITDLTRNRASFRDSALYYDPDLSTTFLIGYNKGLPVALSLEAGQNIVSTKGSINSVSVGNLSLANVTNSQIDTGFVAGYSLTSLRGNLDANVFTPVQPNDYLGYVNAVTYSGYAGTANTFQQVASMAFYATGSNVTYGLGANIAFFTSADGEVGQHAVNQAMSINNDQSVQVMGTLRTDGGIVERGTIFKSFTTSGVNSFVANAAVSTLVIDSSASATIAIANITLPPSPVQGQKFKISTAAPITLANINTPNSEAIRWIASNKFATGNTAVQVTYNAPNSTWYVS
jgi:hypothetical protein